MATADADPRVLPMTMMAHKLLCLHGDEDWDRWGDDWPEHADVVGDLNWVTLWSGPPEWLRDHPRRQLDWGATMYEVSLQEVRRLIGKRPNYADIRDEWDRPFREAEERQNAMLDSLRADGRYAVVWIELY
jgi:hypothetical protein